MRVSERSIYDVGARRLTLQREVLANKTEQAATGRRVSRAGSDPAATAQLQRSDATATRASSMASAAAAADADLVAVDGALGNAIAVLEDALELAIQMADGSFNATDRSNAAFDADQKLGAFVSALNVELDGRFLLGGTRDTTAPFAADGTYLGDDGVRRVEIGPGVFRDVAVRGDAITGGTGGVDIPAVLRDLRAALQSNDVPSVRAAIDGLHAAIGQMAALRSDVGTKSLMLQSAQATALTVRDAVTLSAARVGDADIATAASELALAERAFEAATTATARSFRLTLLDALR